MPCITTKNTFARETIVYFREMEAQSLIRKIIFLVVLKMAASHSG